MAVTISAIAGLGPMTSSEEGSLEIPLTGADLTSRFVKKTSNDGDFPNGTSTKVWRMIHGTGYSMEGVSLADALPEEVEVVSNDCG